MLRTEAQEILEAPLRPSRISTLPSCHWLAQYGAVAILLGVGFVVYLTHHALSWFGAIPGDYIDARFNSVILEHLFLWMQGSVPDLWSPGFFYPYSNVLAFSDNHFGSGWIYVAFRSLGLDREYAYMGWFFVGNVLNYWSMYFVSRKLGFSVLASAAAAFVFSFALPALPKEAHAQLIYRAPIPLCFLFFNRFVNTFNVRCLALASAACAIQFYCSIYLGIFLVYLLIAFALASAFSNDWSATKRLFRAQFTPALNIRKPQTVFTVSIFLLAALSIVVLLLKYQRVSVEYGFVRSRQDIFDLLPTLTSYLLASRSALTSWVGDLSLQLPNHLVPEHQMFFGVGVWIMSLIGLLSCWKKGASEQENTRLLLARRSAITLAILFLATLAVGQHSLYSFMLKIPGVSSIRSVARIVLVMLLPCALLVAMAFEVISKKITEQQAVSMGCRSGVNIRRVGFSGCLAYVTLAAIMALTISIETAFYQSYTTAVSVWTDRIKHIRSLVQLPIDPNSLIFISKRSSEIPDAVELDAMILAQDLGVNTVNGYSGNQPPGYLLPHPCVSPLNRIQAFLNFNPHAHIDIQDLAQRMISIHPEPCPGKPLLLESFLVDRAVAPLIHLGVSAKRDLDRLHVQIAIRNGSPVAISTLSNKGPIRLSWRIRPIDSPSASGSDIGWNTRRDLFVVIKPNETVLETVVTELPAKKGRFILEVTLVQEGVAWFHNLGMELGSVPFNVE